MVGRVAVGLILALQKLASMGVMELETDFEFNRFVHCTGQGGVAQLERLQESLPPGPGREAMDDRRIVIAHPVEGRGRTECRHQRRHRNPGPVRLPAPRRQRPSAGLLSGLPRRAGGHHRRTHVLTERVHGAVDAQADG